MLASGGEDHLVVVWNLERSAAAAAEAAAAAGAGAGAGSSKAGGSKAGSSSKETPPEVLFKHVGHRAGVRTFKLLGRLRPDLSHHVTCLLSALLICDASCQLYCHGL